MPSRMEKYYKSGDIKRRTTKNQELYRTIYDEVEYSNVEGISVIDKDEKIDIEMIKELLNKTNKETPKPKMPKEEIKIEEPTEEEKNYDIMDVLNKAKKDRTPDNKFSDTQYNILKNIKLSDDLNIPKNINNDDLKSMIDAISNNSKLNQTGDLLDDLKSIVDPNMKQEIEEKNLEIDKSFYTSSLGFTNNDFEDLKDMKDSIKVNNTLTKILLFILIFIIIAGALFLVYYFKGLENIF